MNHRLGVLLVIILFIVVIAACSDRTSVKKSAEEADVTDSIEQEDDEYGGTLNVAYNAHPPTLDPSKSTAQATRDIIRHIYEQLVTFDRNLDIQPMLAESYEMNEEENTITFKLREGILFHNGEEMLADDVVASMEKWATDSGQAMSFLEGIQFEQSGDYTVIAKLEKVGSLDMFIFADVTQTAAIMPKEIIEQATADGVTDYIGTGPYQLTEWKQGQYIHLTRFDDYQSVEAPSDGLAGEKLASVEDLFYHFEPDPNARVAGLQSGKYHIATSIPFHSADMLATDINIKNMPVHSTFPAFVFNKKEGVFSDKQMRQAVAAALNIEDMMLSAYSSENYFSLNHELMLEDQKAWYTDAGSDQFDQRNSEKARELMREAGYIGGEIRVLTTRQYEDHYMLAVTAQQQLRAIGMNVILEVVDRSTLMDMSAEPDAYDIFVTSFDIKPTPIQYPFLDQEWPGWTESSEVDDLIEQMVLIEDQEEVRALTEELQEEIWDYLPILKLGNNSDVISMRSVVKGFDEVLGMPILWNVSVEE